MHIKIRDNVGEIFLNENGQMGLTPLILIVNDLLIATPWEFAAFLDQIKKSNYKIIQL